MGNSSSTGTEAVAGDVVPENASGIFMSEDLQQKIIHDFQSRILKEEWERHQKYMIAKGNKRRLQEFQIKEAIDQQFKQFRQQNDLIQSQLDERIDEINARFSDLKNAAEFDANRLDKKLAAIRVNTQEAPCLGPRTSITLCLSEKGPAECDDFIKALEKCVTEAVVFQK